VHVEARVYDPRGGCGGGETHRAGDRAVPLQARVPGALARRALEGTGEMKCEHDRRAVCWLCSDTRPWWREARINAGLPADLHKNATNVLYAKEKRARRKVIGSVLLRAISQKARLSGVPEERLINDLKKAVWEMKI